MTRNGKVSRRGFIAACGATAAAAALPSAAFAGAAAGASVLAHGPALREAYMTEVGRLAESLRPRFETGDLYAARDAGGTDTAWEDQPHAMIEEACAQYFGLEAPVGSDTMAHLVLAASPHTVATADGYQHARFHAQAAAAWDVIAHARARGWYVPTADEFEDPLSPQHTA